MLENKKSIILFTSSIQLVLLLTIGWLQRLNHALSNVSSVLLTIAGVILAVITILHLREKWIGQKLDNELKRKQLK